MFVAVLVLLTSAQIAAMLLCLLLARRAARRFWSTICDTAHAELAALVAGEPCQSASVLNSIGRIVGGEAGRSAKASLMADLSHARRAANADAENAAVSAIGEQHPGVGAVLANLGPKARRGAASNPLVQMALQYALGGGFGQGNGGGNDNHAGASGSSPVRDRLRRMDGN